MAGSPARSQAHSVERVRAVVEPVVTAAGFDVDDLHVSAAGRRSVVKVVVDGEGGITLDQVALLSSQISTALDEHEEAGKSTIGSTPYTLEVTSPGVDRPLTQPRHWQRNVGRLVRVTASGHEITGRILDASDDHVTLEVAGEPQQFNHADLGAGKVQIEFDRKEG